MTCACVACVKWNSYRWQCIKIIKTTFQQWHTNWYQTQYGYCIWTEHLMTWTSIPIVRGWLFAGEFKPQLPPIEISGFIGQLVKVLKWIDKGGDGKRDDGRKGIRRAELDSVRIEGAEKQRNAGEQIEGCRASKSAEENTKGDWDEKRAKLGR